MVEPAVPVATARVVDLCKDYLLGSTVVQALRGVSLAIMPGEFVGIMGPSGSGKSTFMNVVGCLDRPTSGQYFLDGASVGELSPNELAEVRNSQIGFVFQGFNLLSKLTAMGNVELPMVYAGVTGSERRARAMQALEQVGVGDRAQHRPSEMSGGEQQRVAIARGLVNRPALLLADEPTGNLDTRTSIEIMAVLQQLNAAGLTIVMVTHEPDIARYCKRNVTFRDGRVVSDAVLDQQRSAQADLGRGQATREAMAS